MVTEVSSIADLGSDVVPDEGVQRSDMQVVLFELAGKRYGVDVGQVQSVIDMMEITSVPNAPYYVEGVTNLRGEILPVIDLRKKLNIEAREAGTHFNTIVVSRGGRAIGFAVDQVNVVMDLAGEAIEDVPSIACGVENDSIFGVAKQDDYLILLIDLFKVSGSLDEDVLNGSFA